MRYMLIMRATDAALEASKQVTFQEIFDAMGAYNDALLAAGVMRGGDGLADPTDEANFVVDFSQDPPGVTDTPYGSTASRFNGFWIFEVASKAEAIEWASRCPLGPGSKLEVRRLHGDEDMQALLGDDEAAAVAEKEAAQREQLAADETGTG